MGFKIARSATISLVDDTQLSSNVVALVRGGD